MQKAQPIILFMIMKLIAQWQLKVTDDIMLKYKLDKREQLYPKSCRVS